MLVIRLQRVGKTKRPSYRLVISEKARDPQARSKEILGFYNPLQTPKLFEVKKDRIEYWLGVGAQLSNTVHNLLVREGIITGDKKKSVRISKKRSAKLADKQATAKAAAEEKAAKELAVKEAVAPAEEKAVPEPAPEAAETPETTEAAPSEPPAETPAAEEEKNT